MNADSRDAGHSPLVDWEKLGTLRDDEDMVRDIVQTLLDDVPLRVADVHEAIASRSPEKVGDAVHRLKSGFAYLAADGVLAPLHEVEALGRDGQIAAVRGRMPEVEAFVARFVTELVAAVPGVSADGGSGPRRADG